MDDHNTFTTAGATTDNCTVAALFDNRSEAESARDALLSAGFSNVNLSRKEDDADDNSLWENIKAFFTGHERDAGVYDQGVRRGKTLVTVHASEARADDAVSILDRYDPIDLDTHEKSWRDEGWSGESVTAVGDTSDGHNRAAYADEPGPIPGRRDMNRGNGRVRSYLRDLT